MKYCPWCGYNEKNCRCDSTEAIETGNDKTDTEERT